MNLFSCYFLMGPKLQQERSLAKGKTHKSLPFMTSAENSQFQLLTNMEMGRNYNKWSVQTS